MYVSKRFLVVEFIYGLGVVVVLVYVCSSTHDRAPCKLRDSTVDGFWVVWGGLWVGKDRNASMSENGRPTMFVNISCNEEKILVLSILKCLCSIRMAYQMWRRHQ